MPLTPSAVSREALHTRKYHMQGFERSDGLWDIEGQIVDTKGYSFPNEARGTIHPGEPLHDMAARITLDTNLVVVAIEVVTDAAPYTICPDITPNFQKLVGVTMGKGWSKSVIGLTGGRHGCTHIVDLLRAMATVAFQTMWARGSFRQQHSTAAPGGKPPLLNTCHAFADNSSLTKEKWPEWYQDHDTESQNRENHA